MCATSRPLFFARQLHVVLVLPNALVSERVRAGRACAVPAQAAVPVAEVAAEVARVELEEAGVRRVWEEQVARGGRAPQGRTPSDVNCK